MLEGISVTEIAVMAGGWVSSIATYFVGKRNAEVSTDAQEIQNLKDIIAEQRTQISFLNERISDLQSQIKALHEELKTIRGFE